VFALIVLGSNAVAQSPAGGGEIAWLGAVKMDVTLPNGVMDSYPGGLPLAVESERVPGAVTEQLPFGFLPAHLRLQSSTGAPDPRPTANFTLKSWVATLPPDVQATLRHQSAANRFESPWVVIVADPRASIRWTPAIADKAAVGCSPCERPPHVAGKTEADGVFEIWAHGHTVVVRPEAAIAGDYAYLGQQRRLEQRVPSVIADTVRIADQVLPSRVPPAYGSQAVNGVLMYSGELVRDATDLAIKGRGLDFVLQRFYSSAVYSFGPLGRNFDSPLFARTKWLPSGELLFYDGTGRMQRFAKDLTPEPGVFLRARNAQSGVVIAYPDNTLYHFDQYGRLAKITDRNTTRSDGSDGNTMTFSYDGEGQLAAVIDPVGRIVRFSYFAPTATAAAGVYPGLLAAVNDFDGRTVRYEYDIYGRLVKVTGPDPGSTRSRPQVTRYVWGPAPTSGNFRMDVLRSGQITSEIDGEGRTLFTATYAPGDAWRVETLVTGGETWTYSHNDSAMTVTNPNAHAWKYAFDNAGRVTSVEEPGGATTRYRFDAEGRLASVIRPMGTQTPLTNAVTYGYAAVTSGDKRPMGNVTTITEVPRAGSVEAAAGLARTTSIGYGARNLPTTITDPAGSTTTIVRDERGNPRSMTDAAGVTTTFEYDERGQLRKLVDPRSGTSTYAYETGENLKKGYLQTLTTADGPTTYAVDNRGNVLQRTKAGGATVNYTVNKLDQLEEESTANAKTTFTYDTTGSIATRSALTGTDATGAPLFSTTTYGVDELGRLRTRTEDGRLTTYAYEPAGNLATVTAPGVGQTLYGYDLRDQLVSITQGTRTTQMAYDLDGVQTGMTNARGRTTTVTIDGFGNRVAETNPSGIIEVRTLDAAGRPIDVRTIRRVSDTESYILRWSQFVYDAGGRPTRHTRKQFPSPLRVPVSGDPEGATDVVSQTIYDDAAQKITTIDPRGNATVMQFDALGRVASVTDAAGNVTETTYDENGNKSEEKLIEKHPDGHVETFVTRTSYDHENRLVMALAMNDQSATRFKYDARGNTTEETDAQGRTKKFEYDLRGNKVKEIDPEGGVTEFGYDDADRLVLLRDPNGNETTYLYDEYGNLLRETHADGATWTHTYDENDNRKTTTDPNGTVIANTYDELDRLLTREIVKGPSVLGPSRVTFVYDDLDRTITTETDEGVKTAATYDSIDHLLSESVQVGTGPVRTITNAYDPGGNLLTRTYPTGLVIAQTFDRLNRIESVREGSSALVAYRDAGTRLASRVLSNGLHQTWTYDHSRRLRSIEDRLASDLVHGVTYERSLTGVKTAAIRADISKRWSHDHNRNGWITSEQIERTDSETNSLLFLSTYEIDKALNYRRIARTVQTTETATTTAIDMAINNRNQYTAFDSAALTYDRNGNLRTYRGAEHQYDFENRLKKSSLADGTIIENLYDAVGRKVSTTNTAAGVPRTVLYVLAGDQVLEEYEDRTLAMRYVRGREIDEIVRAERSSGFDGTLDQVFFPLQDELGNVDRLTDATGATLERYEYSGYGEFRIFSSAAAEQTFGAYGWKWLFQGREYDLAIGAYDFRARTLWPELGRFGQADPLGTVNHPNLYQAFLGDWQSSRDPYGMEILPGEIEGPTPYNIITGSQAHNLWTRWIDNKYRGSTMGLEGDTAFYNKSVNTILQRARGAAGRVRVNGNKRPDAARLESNRSVTVWELKPQSYDPAVGGSMRHSEAVQQLGMYTSALHPAYLGRGLELHPMSSDPIEGTIVGRDGTPYTMTAYLATGSDRGIIYYRLVPQGLRRERNLVQRTAESVVRTGPCVATFVGVGIAAGAAGGAAVGGTVGAAGGTLVAPGVGTLTGAGGGTSGGAIIGGIGGAVVGLGQGLGNCF
jgi:RHS repeat-associated protein